MQTVNENRRVKSKKKKCYYAKKQMPDLWTKKASSKKNYTSLNNSIGCTQLFFYIHIHVTERAPNLNLYVNSGHIFLLHLVCTVKKKLFYYLFYTCALFLHL